MFAFHTGSPQVADASFKKGRQHFIRTHNETLSVATLVFLDIASACLVFFHLS